MAVAGFEVADVGPGSVDGGLVVTPGGAWRRFTAGWRELPLLGAVSFAAYGRKSHRKKETGAGTPAGGLVTRVVDPVR